MTFLTKLEETLKAMSGPFIAKRFGTVGTWSTYRVLPAQCTDRGSMTKENAEGIALLRNVAPLMLEVCKEAAEVERMLSYIGSGYPSKHKLSMALAALKTALSEPERGEPDDGGSPELEKHR